MSGDLRGIRFKKNLKIGVILGLVGNLVIEDSLVIEVEVVEVARIMGKIRNLVTKRAIVIIAGRRVNMSHTFMKMTK